MFFSQFNSVVLENESIYLKAEHNDTFVMNRTYSTERFLINAFCILPYYYMPF